MPYEEEPPVGVQEVSVGLMTISEFSNRTRLSAKALRLYDRLGLIVPLEVDSSSGYRYYGQRQVADAVLVGLLRRVGMPLRTIGTVLDADEPTRASLVRTYWDGVEQDSSERRGLVAYLCSRLEGAPMPTHDVTLRTLPERRLASISRHVLAGETGDFFNDAFATLRTTGPGLDGIAGCPFLVFYGEVSDDSDGPIELCRPIADMARTPADGVQIRVEAAHDEAYVRLRKSELAWPAMRAALDDLEAWTRAEDRQPAATFRQVLIADQRTATDDTLVCDLSVPLR